MTTAPTDPAPAPNLCDVEAIAPEYVGAPCAGCGHSTLLHPGPGNPELTACLACRLLDLAFVVNLQLQPWGVDLEARVSALEAQVAGTDPAAGGDPDPSLAIAS